MRFGSGVFDTIHGRQRRICVGTFLTQFEVARVDRGRILRYRRLYALQGQPVTY